MDEHLIRNILIDFLSHFYYVSQLYARGLILLLLSVNHIDQRPTSFDLVYINWIWVFEFLISWEIFHLELDVGIIINL